MSSEDVTERTTTDRNIVAEPASVQKWLAVVGPDLSDSRPSSIKKVSKENTWSSAQSPLEGEKSPSENTMKKQLTRMRTHGLRIAGAMQNGRTWQESEHRGNAQAK